MRWTVPRAAAAAAVAAALVAGIALGGQSLGFWLQTRSQNFQTTMLRIQDRQFRASNSFQQGLVSDVDSKLSQVETTTAEIQSMPTGQQSAWEAQRYQVVQQICADAAQLTSPTELAQQDQQFVSVHCVGGSANPATRDTNY